MSILSVKPTADTRQAEETFATDWTDINIYRLSFEVVTSAPSIGGKEVLASGSLPARGSTYSQYADSDVLAWCRRRYAYQNPEIRTRWMVICEFSSEFVDPLNEPPNVRWTTVPEDKPYYEDVEGTRVLNSAEDPFDPTPTRIFGYDEFVITKNFLAEDFPTETWYGARWKVNEGAFTVPFYNLTIEPEEGFLRGYSAETFRRNAIDYVRMTATIWYRVMTLARPNPWHDYIVDMGFREKRAKTGSDRKIHITDYYAHPVSRPALLNGSGVQLPLEDVPVYREFVPYEAADWDPLEIGV